MEIVELAREFMCRVFDIDNLTVFGILCMALAFILRVISMDKVKAWLSHKRVWSRLAVCLILLIIAVYFDFYIIVAIVIVAIVCLSAVFPIIHEWIILYVCRRNYRILERKTIERWIFSTSAKLRFYALRIKNSRDEQCQLLQVALLDKSKNWDIYDFEYKKYVLPHLDVLFKIGAVKSFREECARLSQFDDTSYMQTYKTYLAYDEMEYEEMAKEMEPAYGEDDDARLVTLLNNLCAYEASGEKEKMRSVVNELLRFKQSGTVHCVLYHDLMHYYDEIVHDKEKADALAGEIEEIELGNFGDYLNLMDVAFMHYRRIGHQAKINELVEKIIKKNEQMQKGESCLLTKIRMLYVIMDNGANWQDYSIGLFRDRLSYLNYNARVGAEFIKETLRFLRDLETIRKKRLLQEKLDDIIYDFKQYASRYVDELETEIALIDSRFLYKKRENLLLKLEMLKFIAKDDIVAIRKNNDEIYDRIADMCEYNGNHREYLHFLVVHADDILSMDKQIMEHTDNDAVFADSQELNGYLMLRKTYINNAENIVCRIVNELDKRAYDKSVAYYILYVAYLYMMLENEQRCRFFFSKFERYGVNVKNWTVPVQQIYAKLKQFNCR